MKKILLLIALCTSVLLAWCGKSDVQTCSLTELTGNSCTDASSQSSVPSSTALGTAKLILQSLKDNDLPILATFVGLQGVRFSPYAYVNTGTDIVLSSDEIKNGLAISRSYTWGAFDGSGEPIDLWIGQYFERFVYDLDFLNAPEIVENQEVMRGNIINNAFNVYQGKYIVEFYIPGIDPKYDGMDRRSLTLVLEKTDEKRYLIGIIHNQRTI